MSKQDPFTGIFDNAHPGDFLVTTSAVHTAANTFAGNYELFTSVRLDAVRTTFLATEGQMNPIAHLANDGGIRTFTPDDEESVADFIARLNREAQAMKAQWVFVGITAPVGSQRVESNVVADEDPMEGAKTTDQELKDGLIWYAERHDSTGRSHRSGVMWFGEDTLLVEKSNNSQPFPLMSLILDL